LREEGDKGAPGSADPARTKGALDAGEGMEPACPVQAGGEING